MKMMRVGLAAVLMTLAVMAAPVASSWAAEATKNVALAATSNAWDESRLAEIQQIASLYYEQIGVVKKPSTMMRQASLTKSADAASRQSWWEASSEMENAIRHGENTAESWLNLAQLNSKLGEDRTETLASAWLTYKRAESKPLIQAQALALIGDRLATAGKNALAVMVLEKSISMRPNAELSVRVELLTGRRLAVVRSETQAEDDRPSYCAEFSWPLVETGTVRYEDYIEITPATPVVAQAHEKTLCLEGLQHGQTYKVTWRKGLPSVGAARLMEPVDANVTVAHRQPRVAFTSGAFVMPRHDMAGVPVQTVNLARVKIELLAFDERSLVPELRDNILMRALTGYETNDIASTRGELLWEGEMDIENVTDRQVTTLVPLNEILQKHAKASRNYALYALTVVPSFGREAKEHYRSRATQWIVPTDIGLSSFTGRDGMVVFARSLASAKPLNAVSLRLLAQNNQVLAEMATDANGRATFAPGLVQGKGGRQPFALVAQGAQGDMALLPLNQPAFDLGDRGVGGRANPGPLDAFAYTDRGIYRPGETVHLMSLLRDDKAMAVVAGPAVSFWIFRPDGTRTAQLAGVPAGGLGAAKAELDIPMAARTGLWRVSVRAGRDEDAPELGSTSFTVEDFVPPRIELRLSASKPVLSADAPVIVKAQADFLYGAPGARLPVEAALTVQRREKPFEAWADYSFGPARESFDPRRFPIEAKETDDKGESALTIAWPAVPANPLPLQALVEATVIEPGGRATKRRMILPMRDAGPSIGLRPVQPGDQGPAMPGRESLFEEGKPAAFDVVMVDPEGKAMVGDVSYAIIRENHLYQWYRASANSDWGYRMVSRDHTVKAAKLSSKADGPTRIEATLEPGSYRLEARTGDGSRRSSALFQVGWDTLSLGQNDTPDSLQVAVKEKTAKIGETVEVAIKAPFAGEVQVNVLRDGIVETKTMHLPAEGVTAKLTVTEAWGTGAYVTATAFRPGTGAPRGPGRAIGLAWVGVDPALRTLNISLGALAEVTPRQSVDVPITVTGADQEAYVTLAAVDEGVLQLTDFVTPSPDDYYYGKRRLGVDLRDLYGHLIAPQAGVQGKLRVGGDAASRFLPGLPDKWIKPLALFQGPVRLDAQGRATVKLNLPDFNGSVRLMAVAWDASRVGHVQGKILVRDQVVVTASPPRFMALDDKAEMTLSAHNVGDKPQVLNMTLATSGALALVDPAKASIRLSLAPAQRVSQRIALQGRQVGGGQVTLTVKPENGAERQSVWPLTVRAAQPPQTMRKITILPPGETWTLDTSLTKDLVPGTAQVSARISTVPDLGVAALLRDLSRYPYGCLEQLTSVAMPLLYANELAVRWGVDDSDAALQGRLERTARDVMDLQRGSGAFNLWPAGSEAPDWIGAYALDFLMRAREKGHGVPEFTIERGIANLRRQTISADYRTEQLSDRVFDLYVMARAGAVDAGLLRYVHDTYLPQITSPMALAQLGASLARLGDAPRADAAFAAAAKALAERPAPPVGSRPIITGYDSELRDRAAVLTLAAEAGRPATELMEMGEQLATRLSGQNFLTTQEQSWVVRAALALIRQQGSATEAKLEQDGKPSSLADVAASLDRVDPSRLQAGIKLRNADAKPLYRALTVFGVPTAALPEAKQGLSIQRQYKTQDGQDVNLAKLRQNDLIVVILKVTPTQAIGSNQQAPLLVVDLLPAGLEIEKALDGNGRVGLSWLPPLVQTQHVQARDDRFVAAFDFTGPGNPQTDSWSLAYLARAVTPGQYVVPAPMVENMANPAHMGRGVPGRLTVEAR
ncbi:MAG: alpha-2-macroglobulin family protein [Alphaproteobacteria bacterium]|nr:MAG: alpha-2-macroglobulin family protein [Alphaproteobacteria bacterium]